MRTLKNNMRTFVSYSKKLFKKPGSVSCHTCRVTPSTDFDGFLNSMPEPSEVASDNAFPIPPYFDRKALTTMYVGYHPDSYIAHNAHPEFDELLLKFISQNESNNGGDITRLWSFILNIKQILAEDIDGDFAELGVWRGNTAAILAYYGALHDRKTVLFDTYTGFDKKDIKGIDAHRKVGKFSNTSMEMVKDIIGSPHLLCDFVKGYFPDTITTEHTLKKYAIVSLDCDLYEPMQAGLNFFYPLLAQGGILFLHDYSSFYWEGAKQAVDEFCKQTNEYIILMPDKSGSAFIRKSRPSIY